MDMVVAAAEARRVPFFTFDPSRQAKSQIFSRLLLLAAGFKKWALHYRLRELQAEIKKIRERGRDALHNRIDVSKFLHSFSPDCKRMPTERLIFPWTTTVSFTDS